MALSGSALASALISALTGQTTADGALPIFGSTLTSYLQTATVVYSWAGTNTATVPPTPDPVVTFTAASITGSITISKSMLNQPGPALQSLANDIMTGVAGFKIIAPAAWTITTGTFLSGVTLTLPTSGATTQADGMLAVCNAIINWYLGLINPTVLAGTHGPYTGTPGAIMTGIS